MAYCSNVANVLRSQFSQNNYVSSISPDLAPPYLFLFGHIKNCLKTVSFSSEEELLLEIREVLREILSAILLDVFEDWMERLVSVTAHESHYYS
jgi:hypothetical protein